MEELIKGVLIPFAGTSLGAACVFLMKKQLSVTVQRILTGFAAGVMVAASVWSLLIPAIDQSSETMGKLAFLPAAAGFLLGIGFLLLLDRLIPHLHLNSDKAEGLSSKLPKNMMMLLAVTLHNIPEGMAVGVVYAGMLYGGGMSASAALALAIGIAIQNFPEGAIISMPLEAEGMGKVKAFAAGVISGAVEPVGALVTVAAAGLIVPAMPYLLSFAAGAMIYVVVEELIPEMSAGEHSDIGTVAFAAGFTVMMILDVALG
ncbi:MAG: ZIP family metal transporter [Ruminiclostridium sp.]|nr:ZIP family metal transporter [Ruminiclostridium sp.]